MIEAVMVKQATKAGKIKWKVGGRRRSEFPYFKDKARKSAGRRKYNTYYNGRKSRTIQTGEGQSEKI